MENVGPEGPAGIRNPQILNHYPSWILMQRYEDATKGLDSFPPVFVL